MCLKTTPKRFSGFAWRLNRDISCLRTPRFYVQQRRRCASGFSTSLCLVERCCHAGGRICKGTQRHYGKSDDPRADRRSPEAIVRILGKVRRPLPIRLRSQRTIHGLSCSSVFPLFPIISTPHNRVLNLVKLLIHTPKLHCSLNLSYNIRGNWFLSLTCEQRIDVQRLAALTIPPGVMHGP